MKHAEQLNNMEVLAKTKEHRVIHLVLRHMLARKDDYTIDFLGIENLLDLFSFSACVKTLKMSSACV